MSAIQPLSVDKQTSSERVKNDAINPFRTWAWPDIGALWCYISIQFPRAPDQVMSF